MQRISNNRRNVIDGRSQRTGIGSFMVVEKCLVQLPVVCSHSSNLLICSSELIRTPTVLDKSWNIHHLAYNALADLIQSMKVVKAAIAMVCSSENLLGRHVASMPSVRCISTVVLMNVVLMLMKGRGITRWDQRGKDIYIPL